MFFVLYVSTLNTDNTLATLLLFYICVHFYENKLMCTFLQRLANVYFVLFVSTLNTDNTLATLLLFYICVHFYKNKLMCT